MENKRGQGLSTNAIILIVLGIVVLAILVIGFTIGWDKIAPWLSTSNVDTIKTQCSTACSTGSTYDYCSLKRDLKAGDEKLKDVTCYTLVMDDNLKTKGYGIENCNLNCKVSVKCSEWKYVEDGASKNVKVGNVDQTIQTASTDYCFI